MGIKGSTDLLVATDPRPWWRLKTVTARPAELMPIGHKRPSQSYTHTDPFPGVRGGNVREAPGRNTEGGILLVWLRLWMLWWVVLVHATPATCSCSTMSWSPYAYTVRGSSTVWATKAPLESACRVDEVLLQSNPVVGTYSGSLRGQPGPWHV